MDKPVLWNLNWKFYDYFETSLLTEDSGCCTDINLPHTVKELPLSYFSHEETAMISTSSYLRPSLLLASVQVWFSSSQRFA